MRGLTPSFSHAGARLAPGKAWRGPLLAWLLLAAHGARTDAAEDHERIRGVTISCQTWGWEWGQDAFADELAELAALGTNWVAIHPYAGVRGDGSVRPSGGALDPEDPPPWLRRPIEAAAAHRMAFFVKPHLAYWGSPFEWRGEIHFEAAEERERFWTQYTGWIVALARATRDADAFCVGTSVRALARTFSITLRPRCRACLGFLSGRTRRTTRPVMPSRRLATTSRPTPRPCFAPTTESPKTVCAPR